MGISPYLTLDNTCKIEQIWKELNPVQNVGEVGGSNNFLPLDVIAEEVSNANTTHVFDS